MWLHFTAFSMKTDLISAKVRNFPDITKQFNGNIVKIKKLCVFVFR